MSPTLDAFLRSWSFEPWFVGALVLTGAVYLRGWLALYRRDPLRWHGGRLAAFWGGLATTYVALASPIEPFASLLLQIHMVQHLLLMMVMPPLVWLGAPLLPLVRGLPRHVRLFWAGPLLRLRGLRATFAWLTHPLVAWPLFVAVMWWWHLPPNYELALARTPWHVAEHVCFAGAGLLFWFPVVRPYPVRPKWTTWLLFPYLILFGVQNTVLAAWLTFSPGVLYAHYEQVPRVAGVTALEDQAAAGVIMWVPGSIVLLAALFAVGVDAMFGQRAKRAGGISIAVRSASRLPALPILNQARPAFGPSHQRPFDLLDVWWLGRLLRWRHGRVVLQSLLAAVAGIVIYDGLYGPQTAPMNLGGVLPWIHWRGVLVVGLLVAGNFFCMACPFTLPRTLARRLLPARLNWPRWLRNKWLAVVLLCLFLWSYEAFALWDSPWLTAWFAIGYFVASFAVDGLFRGAAFCKYVCPIGQFNFVQSLVSPLEVKVRDPAACTACRTKECIRGTSALPGCQMQLFQPRKSGNLDCTFCLDCVRACPHENVGVLAAGTRRHLWSDRFRSGVGRFSRRPDLAALVLVLVFGALANAAGMVGPVVEWQERLRERLGNPSWAWITGGYYAAAIVVLPIFAVATAALISRAWGGLSERLLAVATRFSYALVPLGFAMWLAHYSFHMLTSAEVIVPATQRFAADVGFAALGDPVWQWACCRPVASWLVHLQVLMLDAGLLASLYVAYRVAEEQTTRASHALRAFAPWAVLTVTLFVIAVWIVYQPMEMRGTLGLPR